MIKEFMGVNIIELVKKHTQDDIFLKNGCAKELVKLTGIDLEDAKDIVEDTYNDLNPVQEESTTSIKTSLDLDTYEPKQYTSPITTLNTVDTKPKKQQIKQNKKGGVACCPKCGSTSISTTNKKLSITRGLVGGVLLGPIGAGVGAVTSKKVINVCINCGHNWKP